MLHSPSLCDPFLSHPLQNMPCSWVFPAWNGEKEKPQHWTGVGERLRTLTLAVGENLLSFWNVVRNPDQSVTSTALMEARSLAPGKRIMTQ